MQCGGCSKQKSISVIISTTCLSRSQISATEQLISLHSLRPLYLPCFKAKFPLQISLLWDKKKSYLILCYDDIFWLESGFTHCLCDSGITILLVVKLIPSWVGRRDEGAEVRSKAVSKLWLVCQKRQFLHRSGQEGRKQSTDFFFVGDVQGCQRDCSRLSQQSVWHSG